MLNTIFIWREKKKKRKNSCTTGELGRGECIFIILFKSDWGRLQAKLPDKPVRMDG